MSCLIMLLPQLGTYSYFDIMGRRSSEYSYSFKSMTAIVEGRYFEAIVISQGSLQKFVLISSLLMV